MVQLLTYLETRPTSPSIACWLTNLISERKIIKFGSWALVHSLLSQTAETNCSWEQGHSSGFNSIIVTFNGFKVNCCHIQEILSQLLSHSTGFETIQNIFTTNWFEKQMKQFVVKMKGFGIRKPFILTTNWSHWTNGSYVVKLIVVTIKGFFESLYLYLYFFYLYL